MIVAILTAAGAAAIGAEPAAAAATTYQGFDYGTSTTNSPTADKPQSKLWFHDDSWWALMLNPADARIHVYELLANHTWSPTPAVVDNRPSSTGDALWDGSRLYVASRVANSNARVNRLSYDTATRTYSVDPGFPVTLSSVGGSESISIDKDSTGRLWLTYTRLKKVWVVHSTSSDSVWGSPFQPPVGNTSVASDDLSAIIAFNNRVGVMWSDQLTGAFRFAVHIDGASDSAWSSEVAIQAPGMSDDHINLKSLSGDSSGRIFAAVKTSQGDNGEPLTAPLILVLSRSSAGEWSSAVGGQVGDNHTRPILQLDESNNRLLLIATAPVKGGTVYYKTSPLTNVSFPTGKGQPLIQWAGAFINNPSGSKQPVNSRTGLVVIASTNGSTSHRYYHAEMPIVDETGPATPTGLVASSVGTASVDLAWSPSLGATGYTVYRDGSQIGTSTTTAFHDNTVNAGVTYSYQVDAFDAANNHSARSSAFEVATVGDTGDPTVPAGLKTTSVGESSVGLAWQASADTVGVTGYTVHRGGVPIGTSTSTSFEDTTVSPDTGYTYTVDAYDAAGNHSAQSEPPLFVTTSAADGTAPGAPTDLVDTNVTASEVTLAWTAPLDVDVTGYTVYRDGGPIGTSPTTSYNDTAVLPGTDYTYTVDAYDAAGNHSAPSPSSGHPVTTPPDGTKPTPPTSLATTSVTASVVGLTWTASQDDVAVTGYTVYRGGTVIGTSTSTSYQDTTVSPNTGYTYTVDAFDAADNHSDPSNGLTVTTPANQIAFRASSSATNNTASTLVVPTPGGVMAGDVLLASVSVRGRPTVTPPVGWELVRSDDNSTAMRQVVAVHVAEASDPGSFTWQFSSAVAASGTMSAYSGVDSVNPVDAVGGQANAETSPISAPSVTSTSNGAMVITTFGFAAAHDLRPPAAMVERAQAMTTGGTYQVTQMSADASQPAAGPTGVRTATADRAFKSIGQVVVLRSQT